MKKIICLILALIVFNQCRYKDNDRISLYSVKKRLEKTWILKEGIRDGVNITSYYLNEELNFSGISKNSITIQHTGRVGITFEFTHNKTTIYSTNGIDAYNLKITKLTNKELWMEGNCVGGFIGSSVNNIIKVKYSAK
jgi:hypothetical protein